MDALSDVLRIIQLIGAVHLDGSFSAPWCVIGQADSALCSAYLPPSENVVSFHLLTEGSCFAMLPGDPTSLVQAEAGDVIVVPQGETHVLGSSPGLVPEVLGQLLANQVETKPGEVMTLTYGGGGEVTRMVCGFLAPQDHSRNPLLCALPRLFKVSMRGSGSSWLESSLRFATAEAASGQAGSATVLTKLAELVFVEAVRRYVSTMADDRKGWLAGLRDRFVARALALMHSRTAYAWTVDALAREVGISRSGLAQRFTELVGLPPMQYLASWRLQLAARQLRLTNSSLMSIAEDAGYDSEASFNRAFKREFGQPPATWRRNMLGAATRDAGGENGAAQDGRASDNTVTLHGWPSKIG
ncbi:AraC family transcriptional regulator [Caballeronia arationis]|jgi:AraC-like DNA-binding protein|uniref:Transcriptional regulator, AraC family n=1 Tax=Caballeronia arationis TaxID=1777142 RepID=A0A7Z7I318_9BURK|nr:AraC family transcriptional regulator [Caballeronia arationis]SAL01100.1 AraC family transcriptional regulator [Caballeronia arationis]SOE54151.1 transcriptional regulator, AraC family [Caballeronia arationis]